MPGYPAFDNTVAHSARVWKYWLGDERDCYPADQEAGDLVLARFPGITDTVRELRYFTARAVRFLAKRGVRQFLDIGPGFPFLDLDHVHEIAENAAPGSRTVYADNDKLVLAHARALLTGLPGAVTYIDADLSDPASLLDAAREELDFSQPVAILLMSILGHLGDPSSRGDRTARQITGQLRDALPHGGYLAIGDLAARADLQAALEAYNTTGAAPYRARSAAQLAGLLDGLDLIRPGTGPASSWRPEMVSLSDGLEVPAWGGVGCKR